MTAQFSAVRSFLAAAFVAFLDPDAWWDRWLDCWGDLGDEFDPQHKLDDKARAYDHLDADIVSGGGGGNFDGAGTGGQD